MITKHTYKNLVWIDVEKPLHNELYRLEEEYRLPSHTKHVCAGIVPLQKVEIHTNENVIFFSLLFPIENNLHLIFFVVGPSFLITTHQSHLKSMTNFSHMFEKNGFFDTRNVSDTPPAVLSHLIEKLYQGIVIRPENTRAVEKAILPHQEIIRFLESHIPKASELFETLLHQLNLLHINAEHMQRNLKSYELEYFKSRATLFMILFVITLALLIINMI